MLVTVLALAASSQQCQCVKTTQQAQVTFVHLMNGTYYTIPRNARYFNEAVSCTDPNQINNIVVEDHVIES